MSLVRGPLVKKHLAGHRWTVASPVLKNHLWRNVSRLYLLPVFCQFPSWHELFEDQKPWGKWWWWWFRCSVVAQSWPTLCDPMDCSPPGSSIHGILSARVLEWVAIPFSRGSSQPRDQTCVSFVSFLAPPPRRCHQKPWKKLRPDQASFFKPQKSKICFLLIIKVLCNHYWKLIKKRMKKINHNPVTQKWPSILQDISSQFVCVSFPCPRVEHNIFKYFLCNITYSQGV